MRSSNSSSLICNYLYCTFGTLFVTMRTNNNCHLYSAFYISMIKIKYHMFEFSVKLPVKLPVHCEHLNKYQRLSFVMDETIIYLSKPLDHQLHQIHAPFEEVSQQTFHQLQTHYRGLRSLIYRSTDIELANGNSQVSFYSLSYIKKNMRTSFFVAKSLFVVPPYMFLGDHEEAKIVQ